MHGPVPCCTTVRTDTKQFGPFFDQSHAAGSSRLAENRETLPHGPTGTRDHKAPFGVRVHSDDADFGPVGLQFICNDTCKRSAHVLPHFGTNDVDCHFAGTIDAVPDCRFE